MTRAGWDVHCGALNCIHRGFVCACVLLRSLRVICFSLSVDAFYYLSLSLLNISFPFIQDEELLVKLFAAGRRTLGKL